MYKWKNDDDKRIHLGGIIVRDGFDIKLINHNYFTGQKSFSVKNFHKFFFRIFCEWRKKNSLKGNCEIIENIYEKKNYSTSIK